MKRQDKPTKGTYEKTHLLVMELYIRHRRGVELNLYEAMNTAVIGNDILVSLLETGIIEKRGKNKYVFAAPEGENLLTLSERAAEHYYFSKKEKNRVWLEKKKAREAVVVGQSKKELPSIPETSIPDLFSKPVEDIQHEEVTPDARMEQLQFMVQQTYEAVMTMREQLNELYNQLK